MGCMACDSYVGFFDENFCPDSCKKEEQSHTHTPKGNGRKKQDFTSSEPEHFNLMNGKCFQVNKQQIYVLLLGSSVYVCLCACVGKRFLFRYRVENWFAFNFFRSHNSSFHLARVYANWAGCVLVHVFICEAIPPSDKRHEMKRDFEQHTTWKPNCRAWQRNRANASISMEIVFGSNVIRLLLMPPFGRENVFFTVQMRKLENQSRYYDSQSLRLPLFFHSHELNTSQKADGFFLFLFFVCQNKYFASCRMQALLPEIWLLK